MAWDFSPIAMYVHAYGRLGTVQYHTYPTLHIHPLMDRWEGCWEPHVPLVLILRFEDILRWRATQVFTYRVRP